jgi:hypothetical protein
MLHRRLRYVSTALVASGVGRVLHLLQVQDLCKKSGRERPRHAQKAADSPKPKQPRGVDDALLIDLCDGRHRGNPKVHRSKIVGQVRVLDQFNLGRQVRPLQWRFVIQLALQVSDGQRDILRPGWALVGK